MATFKEEIEFNYEIPKMKIVPEGYVPESYLENERRRASSIRTASSNPNAKYAVVALFLFLVAVAFFFGHSAYKKWSCDQTPPPPPPTGETNTGKTKSRVVHNYYVPSTCEQPTSPLPQDNTLEKANEYTDKKFGEVTENLNNFKDETRQNFGVVNNNLNDIKGMLKDKHKPQRKIEDCAPSDDDDCETSKTDKN